MGQVASGLSEHNQAVTEATLADLTARGFAEATLRSYKSDLRKFARILDGLGLRFEDLDKHNLVHVLERVKVNDQGRTLANSRLRSVFSALSAAMDYLVHIDEVEVNPIPTFRKRYLHQYKRNQGSDRLRLCPTNEQMRAVIATSNEPWERAVHLVLAKTGLRSSELWALDVDDVDLIEGRITAKPRAKRSSRDLPIDRECSQALHAWLLSRSLYPNAEAEPALFINSRGNRLGRNTLLRLVNRAGEKVGLHNPASDIAEIDKRFTPHSYRHWMTTALRDGGCPDRVIRHIRGDDDHSIVDHYDHLRWQTIEECYIAAMPGQLSSSDSESTGHRRDAS